jgi:hypothetical protein
MTALRQVAVLAKGRCEQESFSTMRSSSARSAQSGHSSAPARSTAVALHWHEAGQSAAHQRTEGLARTQYVASFGRSMGRLGGNLQGARMGERCSTCLGTWAWLGDWLAGRRVEVLVLRVP